MSNFWLRKCGGSVKNIDLHHEEYVAKILPQLSTFFYSNLEAIEDRSCRDCIPMAIDSLASVKVRCFLTMAAVLFLLLAKAPSPI